MTQHKALYKHVLNLGDNALVLSYRLSEWCSRGPLLEEDLALTNLALDLTGRAQLLLDYAGEVEGRGKTADELAYRRGERDFLNNLIMELPNGDFAFTIVRQLLVAAFEYYYYDRLLSCTNPRLAAIAAKTVKEVKYHLAHAADWVIRLGDGTAESHERAQKALDELWIYTGEFFEKNEVGQVLFAAGVIPDVSDIKPLWRVHVERVLAEATLAIPEDGYMQTGGSASGIHTEHMGHILTEMQYLQRAYPDAKW